MATALGCLPSAIDDEPVVNVFRLLEYWLDEPPAHVSLATQRPGGSPPASRPASARQPGLNDTKAGMAEMAAMMGPAIGRPGTAPEGFADVVNWADEMEAKVKGRTG